MMGKATLFGSVALENMLSFQLLTYIKLWIDDHNDEYNSGDNNNDIDDNDYDND